MSEKLVNVESVGAYFESPPHPRHEKTRRHLLWDIVVIAVCGIVCGCDGPTAIHGWASHRQECLSTFLRLPQGIPSRDCIRRLLIALRPEAFQKCFQEWVSDTLTSDEKGGKRLVAIDGKPCRRSHDASQGFSPLHIVSAWTSEEGIALGQVATEETSNKITAIPRLLKQIALTDTIVTIHAMRCQKEIAKEIVTGGGGFVIAVNDNQPRLCEAIEAYFAKHLETDLEHLQYRSYETSEQSHGRLDERSYYLTKVPADFALKKDWPWVKAIGYSLRMSQRPGKKQSCEVRYDIVSHDLSSKRFSEAVRGHWSIESMHWVLDITFREDDSRTRERTMGNNLSWLRRFAVASLKGHPIVDSIRRKTIRCSLSTNLLSEVLKLQHV